MTRHVLLPLFDDVVLLEPVSKFINEATRAAGAGEWRDLPVVPPPTGAKGKRGESYSDTEEGKAERKEQESRVSELKEGRGKRGRMVQGGLQGFNPAFPVRREGASSKGVFGEGYGADDAFGEEEKEVVYDA